MQIKKSLLAFGVVAVAVAGLRVASAVSTTSEAPLILCANKKTGALRLIPRGNCTTAETKYEINRTGPQGLRGATGPAGPPGADGEDGADGQDGVDGLNGANGADGADGAPGPPGADGADAPIPPSMSYSADQLRRGAWYEAPTVPPAPVVAADVGIEPTQAVFDGQNIWVVSSSGYSVSRINARTNAVTTFPLSSVAGMYPTGIALMSDQSGANISYIAIGFSSLVSSGSNDYTTNNGIIKRIGLDGTELPGSTMVQYGGPRHLLASDTNYVWSLPSTTETMFGLTDYLAQYNIDLDGYLFGKVVSVSAFMPNVDYIVADCACDGNHGVVAQYVPSTPPMYLASGFTVDLPTDAVITRDDYLWVISLSAETYTKISISLLRPFEGNFGSTASVSSPNAIATDGTDVYVISSNNNSITRIKGANGAASTIYFDNNVSYRPVDIVFDGTYFWVVNGGSSNVVKVAPW
jgi:hypothetical protein